MLLILSGIFFYLIEIPFLELMELKTIAEYVENEETLELLASLGVDYAQGQQIWVRAQPSEYYTRHLMLHEGVHCLAFAAFGGAGPTWYQEGTAELLATHGGVGTELTVNRIPANRDQVRGRRAGKARASAEPLNQAALRRRKGEPRKVEPGETRWQVASEFVREFGYLIWSTADGRELLATCSEDEASRLPRGHGRASASISADDLLFFLRTSPRRERL